MPRGISKYKSIGEVIGAWERLGSDGFIVSVTYGPMDDGSLLYSVGVLDALTSEMFERPFAARSVGHAIEIAEQEIVSRGWSRKKSH